jgi:hypothetical protein
MKPVYALFETPYGEDEEQFSGLFSSYELAEKAHEAFNNLYSVHDPAFEDFDIREVRVDEQVEFLKSQGINIRKKSKITVDMV